MRKADYPIKNNCLFINIGSEYEIKVIKNIYGNNGNYATHTGTIIYIHF